MLSRTAVASITGAVIFAVVVGVGASMAADETSTPMPVPSMSETPMPTDSPSPSDTPTPSPTAEPTPAPTAEPEREAPTGPFPKANTVKEAVTQSLAFYCPNVNSGIVNQANWRLWDPNSIDGLGYWEVSAQSQRGMVIALVTPNGGTALVEPYGALSEQAFSAWGCPTGMYVQIGGQIGW